MIPNIFICDKKHLKFGVQTADSHFAMASVTQEAHSTLAKEATQDETTIQVRFRRTPGAMEWSKT